MRIRLILLAALLTGHLTGHPRLLALRDRLAVGGRVIGALRVDIRPHAVEDTFHTDWASRARSAPSSPWRRCRSSSS